MTAHSILLLQVVMLLGNCKQLTVQIINFIKGIVVVPGFELVNSYGLFTEKHSYDLHIESLLIPQYL